MRFLIRKAGQIVGAYPPSTDKKACADCETDDDALNAYARDEGHKDFAALKSASGVTITDFTAEKIEE